jgi:hypothetical protein
MPQPHYVQPQKHSVHNAANEVVLQCICNHQNSQLKCTLSLCQGGIVLPLKVALELIFTALFLNLFPPQLAHSNGHQMQGFKIESPLWAPALGCAILTNNSKQQNAVSCLADCISAPDSLPLQGSSKGGW